MAAGSHSLTASKVGDLVTAEGNDDTEFLFPRSDDDFDASLEDEYDPVDREQVKQPTLQHCLHVLLNYFVVTLGHLFSPL